MYSTQGSIRVNVTPPTKTITQSNGDFTQGMNGIDVTLHENTKPHCEVDITKGTTDCSSPSPLIDGKVSSWWMYIFFVSLSVFWIWNYS